MKAEEEIYLFDWPNKNAKSKKEEEKNCSQKEKKD